jgi:tRNA pseudouridine38-40 synthase
MRLAFAVSYLGGGFAGSQMQPGLRTVEGEFIAACERLQLFSDWRKARFSFSGRTDRGVHARGQVVAFDTDQPDRALQVLNLLLPRDCWCTAYAEVPSGFHPRYDARSRTYRYYYPEPGLDVSAMNGAAALFLGRHDFSCFARIEDHDPERTILSAEVRDENGFAVFEVTGESFLWNMVRCMATVLRLVGRGRAGSGMVEGLLEKQCEQRIAAAPAEGLILWKVDCGIALLPLPSDTRSSEFLETTRQHHALMERVCSLLHPGQ